jgi:CcmD family protein
MRLRRLFAWSAPLLAFAWTAAPLLAQQAQTGFVPLSQAPPSERIPAAPFVFIAYGVAWLAVLFYVWSIWRRLGRVDRELHDLQRKVADRGSVK